MAQNRTCYLMVRDVESSGPEDCGLEWGVDFGIGDDEELPKDIEELTEAQYTVYKMMAILKGTFEEMGAEQIKGDRGTGLIVPDTPIG